MRHLSLLLALGCSTDPQVLGLPDASLRDAADEGKIDAGQVDGSVDAGTSDGGASLRNFDVTIVYPLPPAAQLDAMIGTELASLGGSLLPREAFAEVPELDDRSPLFTNEARLASLRVVAIRFDPCPGELAPPLPSTVCKPDIRLIFQSLDGSGSQVTARDGAIHAFYEVPSSEFSVVLDELRALRAASPDPDGPLGVHPALAREGVDGAFAQAMKSLLAAHTGDARLVRVTSFQRLTPSFPAFWRFEIREPISGVFVENLIPTTEVTVESLVTISGGRWDAMIDPAPSIDDPTRIFRVATEEREQALNSVARVLNPRAHSSESIDCASCHVAPDIAIFVRETMSLDVTQSPDAFHSSHSLDGVPKDVSEAIGFENIHMSSYSGSVLSLSTRTVHETAVVLEVLEGR